MTVSSTSRKAGPFSGNGSTTSFPFSFKVFTKNDIVVVKTDSLGVLTTLVLDSDYSVSVNANQDTSPGGTVTYPITGTPLASGTTLTIAGNLAYSQSTQLPSGGAYNATNVESALDRLTMLSQQLLETSSRALTVPVSTSSSVSAVLPTPAATQLVGWDNTGLALRNYDPTALGVQVAYAQWRTQRFSGTGSQTAFVLPYDAGVSSNIDLRVGGVPQTPDVDFTYTASTKTITFTSAPYAGTNNIVARYGEGLTQTGTVPDGSITTQKIADQAVTTAKLPDQAVTTAKLADANVTLAKLSATGTPSISTYLRGDNTWAGVQAGFSGATTNAASSSAITLAYNSNQYQVAQINSAANSYVTLPNATTMLATGSNPFVIENRSPIGANLEIRDFAGTTVGYIAVGSIGLVQLKDKSTSAGQWAVETTTPQTFIKYDANSLTNAATSPAGGQGGIVGLTSTLFVRWWSYSVYNGTTYYAYLYTQACTISGSVITVGTTQSYNYNTAAGNQYSFSLNIKATRLSSTAFVVLLNVSSTVYDSCNNWNHRAFNYIQTNTVSGTTVTFGSTSAAGMPSYSLANNGAPTSAINYSKDAVLYNGLVTRLSDTSFALFYNDNYTGSYPYPYNYSGSLSCQIVTVSGTTMTIGTKANLGTSTYTQPLSAVALSSTAVVLAYGQAAAAGGTTGRTKLNVVTVSGTTATFNGSTTCEATDVSCFGTSNWDAAVAPSSTQFWFNSGYSVGEATVSGTTVTFDSFPKSTTTVPLYLCTSTRAYGPGAYFDIVTGGFVTNTNVVTVIPASTGITAVSNNAPLGAQPTTALVGTKQPGAGSSDPVTYVLGTTT